MKAKLLLLMLIFIGRSTTVFSQQVLGNFTKSESFEWPKVIWQQDLTANWDEGLIKTSPSTNGIARSGYGIHMHESRQFSFWSTNLQPLLSIEGGSGNIFIRGKLGIGTTTPLTQFNIQGGDESITLGNYNSPNITKGIYFPGFRDVLPNYFGASIESVPDWICCGGYPAATGYPGIRNMGLNFNVHGDVGVADSKFTAMAINSAGNVGIGTLTPRERLSVNGTVRSREVKVEAANWPDYVFENSYKVETLEGLESYIKANKHLPEMPTAKEVEANGIALGEINKLLLKKIEELTLHLIEKEHEIQEIKASQMTSQKKTAEDLATILKRLSELEKLK